jgi:hypothetical protein
MMFVLTIVFLFWPVTIQSNYASMDTCEQAAQRARAFDQGPQSVKSATCALAPVQSTQSLSGQQAGSGSPRRQTV